VRNHAGAMLACDFFVTITARFRTLYVFVLTDWVMHYNRGRPLTSLGPGIPGARDEDRQPSNGHRIPNGHRVVAVSILAGLHHEYRLESLAA
jgi:hypothetical protein